MNLEAIKTDLVEFITKKGSKSLFKTKDFVEEKTPGGPDRYFLDLSKLNYRREMDKPEFASRSWKIAFKYLIVSKEIFEKAKKQKVNVLDLGCGKGFLRRVLEANIRNGECVHYYGIDIKRPMLEAAIFEENLRTGAEGDKIPSFYIIHNLNKPLPIKTDSIDIVVSFQVTKYNEKNNVKKLFEEVYRVLKNGGKFYLSTDPVFDKEEMKPSEDFMKRVGYKSFWHTQELVKTLENIGFKNIEILGAENSLNAFIENSDECELKIINKMRKILPDEIIESLFGFLHPETTFTKLILASKLV